MEAVEAFSSQKSAILSNSVPHWHRLKHFPGSPKPWQCRTALCQQFWGDFRENQRDLVVVGGRVGYRCPALIRKISVSFCRSPSIR